MPNDQNQNDWQHGFLVKDASGGFTKVADDSFLDVDSAESATPPAAPAAPSTPPAPTPPARVSAPTPAAPVASPKAPAKPSPPTPQRPIAEQGPAPSPFADVEDEAEIQKHQDALSRMASQPNVDVSTTVQAMIEKLVQSQGIAFGNDVLRKRFTKVLESRLRNIRNSLETADVLARPEKIGGLNLPKEQVDTIMAAVETEAAQLHQRKTSPAPAPKQKPTAQNASLYSSAPPAFVPRPGGATPERKQEQKESSELEREVQTQLDELKKQTPPASAPPPAVPQSPPTPASPPGAPTSPPTPPTRSGLPTPTDQPHELYGQPAEDMPRIRPLRSDKPHVVDIRQPSQVVGPIEEIRQTDLKEFRRMGTNPSESAEKIKEKIDLLEEESWEERVQAIRAWKESPVFRLYVDIGRASLDTGNPVEKVIDSRKAEQKEFVLPEEFYAINELNMSMQI